MTRSSSASENQNSSAVQAVASLLVIFFFLCSVAKACLAQTPIEGFQKTLGTQAGLTVDDWSSLEHGGVVVKLLPAADKREVRVYGLTRLPGTPDEVVKAFQESMVQQKHKSLLSKGKFGNPPTLGDVETLALESGDIEDLRTCVVGRCELKLSVSMIARFQRDVNWNSVDYATQVNRLYREMLIDYVRDYQMRGDAALVEYHDQRRSVLTRDEQQTLFERMLYLHEFAPEFADYLTRFPYSELPDVESHVSWTKVKFGLKPIITVNHAVTYRSPQSGQILTVTKQLYANHYLDSSLALTAVLRTPTSSGDDFYLLYANYSRSDSLAGSFSRVRRGLVETESVENLNALLHQTRANLPVESANQSGSDPTLRNDPITEWLLSGIRPYAWLFALTALGVSLFVNRRKGRRVERRSTIPADGGR
ncbi:MAG TPA: hypothetical protein VJU86_11440 [Pyrinomonadaceae bacterium]|nr:hypothetical protein [Pyrinomonadaceae bacterium]